MSKCTPNNTLKVPLYGNCHVQNPDGTHIFNCGDKKAQWYLKRNLAVVVQQEPFTIRLTFKPNGKGHADDAFYLQKRQNICVCCGREELLTKHHVVPYCYRKFFPEHLKNHTAYDVLPVCYECHEEYEIYAQEFKTELAAEHSVERKHSKVFDGELKKVCMAASALSKGNKSNIPEERYQYLMGVVRNYYGRDDISQMDIENASQIAYNTQRENYKPEGQAVVENLSDIEAFVKRWRKHFIETMQPQHMPKHWTVERPL